MFSQKLHRVIALFEQKMQICLSDKSLLQDALTHPSFAKSRFEMLEFIGDRVLGLAAARFLWMPKDEKQYALELVSLTNKSSLIRVAKHMRLDSYLSWRGIKSHKDTIMADALEAVVGAIFLDLGFEEAYRFIKSKWLEVSKKSGFNTNDAKSILQTWSDKQGFRIKYHLVKETGLPHDKDYRIELFIDGYKKIYGEGKSIKAAEKEAAEKFLKEFVE